MIGKIASFGNETIYKQHADITAEQQACGYIKKHPYADSFVRNAARTAPVLAILTGIWTACDHKMLKKPVKDLLKNNILYYFLPVLTVSSAVVACIENKKSKNDIKNSEQ